MTLHPVAEDQAAQAVAASTLREVVCILADLADLQVRVSRLAKMLATTRIILPANDDVDGLLKAVANALNEQNSATVCAAPGNTGGPQPGPSTQEASHVDRSACALPEEAFQPQPPTALCDDRRGSSQKSASDEEQDAKGAGEDEASAMDRRSDPAPTDTRPKYERVLDLWGETRLNARGIADQLGLQPSSVDVYLSRGRTLKDRRVLKGDAARDTPFSPIEKAGSFRIPSAPPAPIRTSAPIEVSKPVQAPVPRPGFDPGKIIAVDIDALRAYGPNGEIAVTRPFAHALARMSDGGTYAVETLRDLGPWPGVEPMTEHFRGMRPKLAAIGVDLVPVNKFMYRVQRLEA